MRSPRPRLSFSFPVRLLFATPAFLLGACTTPPVDESPAFMAAGRDWQLEMIRVAEDDQLTPAPGALYTLRFNGDGSLTVRADCNQGTGTWQYAGRDVMSTSPLAMTRAICRQGSFSDEFVAGLAEVVSFEYTNGQLFLHTIDGTSVMEFHPSTTPLFRETPAMLQARQLISRGEADPFNMVTFLCNDILQVTATFYETTPVPAVVLNPIEFLPETYIAYMVPAGSGAHYEGADLEFWTQGDEAMLTQSGQQYSCVLLEDGD